uniref:Vitellogenin domain-containing protein n=1 Tax=Oncorhynchus mykiss TaxID=8022 RepID=A0A8K9X220_ONCMY
MRAVVLALTLALVAPDFAASKTYVYKYEALLLGGLPEEGLARAGVKVISKVLISAVAENTYLLKLVNPEIFEYSGVWPNDPFVPAAKLTSALAAQFSIPIKFEYAKGVVVPPHSPSASWRTRGGNLAATEEIIDQRTVQHVPRGNPTPFLRTVPLPIH